MIQLSGLAAKVLEAIAQIPVVDCHEHLPTEKERTSKTVDATTLFSHYCKADLEAAGLLQGKPQNEVFDTAKPLMPRWQKMKPCVQAIRYGNYAYPAFAYVREILGFEDINDSTVEAISQRMQEDNKPGLYKKLIQDVCRIEKAIQCTAFPVAGDQPFFVYLRRARSIGLSSAEQLSPLEAAADMSIYTLADCVNALRKMVQQDKGDGAAGMKIGAAYQRKLDFPEVSAARADEVFVQLRRSVRSRLNTRGMETLENYLLRREIEACVDSNLPIAIHTGYQAGNKNDIRNARATHLWSILKSYPKGRFDLYHGSSPYVSDFTVLGKYFENISLNMCWMHLMGSELSRRALREWLDAVPVTKIFAFGGDYSVVEKIYGHLALARANVAIVLAEKIEEGRFSFDNALEIARLWFNENPKRWYGLT